MLIFLHSNKGWSIPLKTRKRAGLRPYQLEISTVRFCIYNQIQLLNL